MKRRLGLRPSSTQNWTKSSRYAIGPQYISQIRQDDGKDFEAFTKYVEARRLSSRHGVKGARSLRGCAVNVVLQYFTDLEVDALQVLPKHIVWTIWHEIDMRCTLNLHSWKTLSKALSNEQTVPLGVLRYVECIEDPKEPLVIYTQPLTCSSFDFITFLSIDSPFEVSELVKLAKLTNLGILEIINRTIVGNEFTAEEANSSNVSDRLVRAWGSEAVANGAFAVLRILRLWGHLDITNASLKFVNDFPTLGVFDVRLCALSLDAEKIAHGFGWKVVDHSEAVDLIECVIGDKGQQEQHLLDLYSQPLWDGLQVSRLSGDSNPVSSQDRQFSNKRQQHMSDSDPQWYQLSLALFQKYGKAKDRHWEFESYAAFTKLGELRNDIDLKRAIVDAEDNEGISSVPMVCLRLGSRRPFNSSGDNAVGGRRDRRKATASYIFTRVHVQENAFSRPAQKASGSSGGCQSLEDIAEKVLPTPPKRKVEQGGRLRPKKLKKLDNVLNKFM